MADDYALPALDGDGWTTRPDGMKVKDVTAGSGEACPEGATVTVHYTGWLLNGKVFDSSRQRGETISFGLHQVIRGWTVGVPGMKPGGKRLLYIPPEMAYGKRGAGRDIPPDSTLVFEIELMSFKK
jgi:FKBP-type peptidyl-prolyl cis-trans isomerase